MSSGCFFSQYWIHAGQQEVMIGSLFPSLSLSRNSLDSSRTVMSAPNEVSKTSSKPIFLKAAKIRPETSLPSGMPTMLPRATLTAGATWTTVFTDGLEIASHTFWISLRAVIAPVGHATAHWPQPTHMVSERGFPKAVEMSILEPRKAKSIAPTFCTSWQVLTQSPQRMHLPESKTIEADELVTLLSSALFGKRTPSMLKRTARS